MGLIFRKSFKIFKGLRLNVGSKSSSLSFGTKGARYSVSTTGKRRATVGLLPGSGLYYTKTFGGKKSNGANDKEKLSKKNLQENEEALEDYSEMIEEVKSVHQVGMNKIDWSRMETVPGNVRDLTEGVLQGNPESYYEVVNRLDPFQALVDFGSEFEIGTDGGDYIVAEFDIKEEEVVPKTELVMKADGSLKEKELTKTAYYDLLQDYVCSVTIRLARDLFALLPVNRVIVHAVNNELNTATGHTEEQTYLSVIFDRAKFESLNLDAIDPSDSLNNFEYNMKFNKTQGFKPIIKLENW